MIKIYCIEDINNLKYIGSTKQKYLSSRLSEHKYKKDCSCSRLDLNNCRIYILEECDEKNRKLKEQFWIDKISCVNINNTIINKEKYNLTAKKYHEKKIKLQKQSRHYHKFIQEFRYVSPNLFL